MQINKDTKICISLASKPGNFGALVHNKCYEHFGLNYVYLPLTTNNFRASIKWFEITPSAIGCSVSMPWKREAKQFVYNSDKFDNINTIRKTNDGELLYGYSTDLFAIEVMSKTLSKEVLKSVYVIGYGAMTRNFNKVLRPLVRKLRMLNREQINKFKFGKKYSLVINATPIGMNDDYFENSEIDKLLNNAKFIIDCPVSINKDTRIIQQAKENKQLYIDGVMLSLLQASKQFEIYTGIEQPIVYPIMRKTIDDYRTQKSS